jgi:hypothetical protein
MVKFKTATKNLNRYDFDEVALVNAYLFGRVQQRFGAATWVVRRARAVA